MTDPTVTAVSDEALRMWVEVGNPDVRSMAAELLRARSALAELVAENAHLNKSLDVAVDCATAKDLRLVALQEQRSALSPASAPETAVSELKPCPFCGSANISVRFDRDDPEYTFAQCDTCETQGPVVISDVPDARAKTVARWNRRSALADVGDECETLRLMRYQLSQWLRGANVTDRQRARLTEICNTDVVNGVMQPLPSTVALADVGECERCLGTRKIRTYRKLGDETPQVLECPDCTGKQPRPAAESGDTERCDTCEHTRFVDQRVSPAAHTAQGDASDKLLREIDEYLSGHPQNSVFCGSKLHQDIKRRLAEQGSGAKDGGT